MLWQAVLTALVAGFAPWTLLVVATLLAKEQHPMRHALVFLAAAAAVTLLVGFLVVETLGSTGLENRQRHRTVSPAIDLGIGIAILVMVPFLARRTPEKQQQRKKRKEARKADRETTRSPRSIRRRRREREAGLLAAVALGLFVGSPSPLYLASLHSLSKDQPDAAVGTFEVLLIAMVVLLMAEIPIFLYALAPERTTAQLKAANAWLSRHGHILLVLGATAAGCYFTIHGLVNLL